jgi:hypothetical protein
MIEETSHERQTMNPSQYEKTLLDLSRAVVVSPPNLPKSGSKAVEMLVDEVEKRTRIRLPVVHEWPSDAVPIITVGTAMTLASFLPGDIGKRLAEEREQKPEGYQIRVQPNGSASVVLVAGNDSRGVLFGVGRLLRTLRMERDRIAIPDDLSITSAPHTPLRGHQLGYRPKTNSYDGWDVAQWEQYFRDLAVFGANAVELIPPRSDDDPDSPHFPLPPMEMMIQMSRLLDDYGLDVWIWYPAMDPDYTDPQTVAAALEEWAEVLRQLPRVDAIFVPGGDPGHTPPAVLMPFLEKQTASLRRYHPKAQMWVSPQGFDAEDMETFLDILNREQPEWLTGVVFGPQVRLSLPRLRERVPQRYPIRHYPDITHTFFCQYPAPDWDVAYALTQGREPINPRPIDQAILFRRLNEHTVGFLTYSEGCNDDVNKMVWSALGWNPDADVTEILREYSRYFISDRYTEPFAQGLLALERNWHGPLATNDGVYTTLEQFQAIECSATPQERLNWRFQQALYRAYFDAATRRRLLYETELEAQAMDILRAAERTGTMLALEQAEGVLEQAVTHPVAPEWRARVFALAEALFQSIRMQLSVERYQAIAVGRGANLDTIDVPLNNRLWLKARFAELRQLPTEAERLTGIAEIVHWKNPDPGGFYDQLGDPTRRPHLVGGTNFDTDPGAYDSPRTGFATQTGRIAWSRYAETLYDTPLQMRYTGLDPEARYTLRVVYSLEQSSRKVRLVAGEDCELHPLLTKPNPIQPLEFDIPAEAITNGELTLTWTNEPGLGRNGRGCQVCEVWLLRSS